jgi:hypothetical protein
MNTNDIEIIREALNGGKASASTAAHFFEGYGHEKNLDRIDAALAALDQLEAQQRDIAKMEEVGDAMAKALWNPDRDYDATLRSAWNAAKSATPPQQQARHLTKDDVFFFVEGMQRNEWPLLQDAQDELQTLSKAWPYLAEHASRIDGAFNIAHGNLRSMVSSLIQQRDRAVNAVLTMYERADASPATSPQQQPKRLTDEHYRIIANRMLEEHGKYGDKLRAGHWAEIAARKVVSHLQDFGYIGGLSVEESDSIQRMLDMVDELMKLKDIHRKKLIGTATKEEWAYYQLQCEAIYPGVKDAADQMRARLTAKLNGTLS